MEPEFQHRKEVIISLLAAVAKENNRSSITSLQEAGRLVELAPDEPDETVIAGPSRTVTDEANRTVSGPSTGPKKRQRQRRAKAGNGPDLQPNLDLNEPDLPANLDRNQPDNCPTVSRTTRKHKAVDIVGASEVDLGPRKLRNRTLV
jgi:hypothetical protein